MTAPHAALAGPTSPSRRQGKPRPLAALAAAAVLVAALAEALHAPARATQAERIAAEVSACFALESLGAVAAEACGELTPAADAPPAADGPGPDTGRSAALSRA